MNPVIEIAPRRPDAGSRHLQDEQLENYVLDRLSGAEREKLEWHLGQCTQCMWALLQTDQQIDLIQTVLLWATAGDPDRSMPALSSVV